MPVSKKTYRTENLGLRGSVENEKYNNSTIICSKRFRNDTNLAGKMNLKLEAIPLNLNNFQCTTVIIQINVCA